MSSSSNRPRFPEGKEEKDEKRQMHEFYRTGTSIFFAVHQSFFFFKVDRDVFRKTYQIFLSADFNSIIHVPVLVSFYRAHNRKFVRSVDDILRKNRGRETELMRKICTKYGEHPLDFWAMQPSSHISDKVLTPKKASPHLVKKENMSQYERLIVVLDLDETLIHTTDITDRYSPNLYNPETLRDQTPEAFLIRVKGEILLCRKRPGVHQFLARASSLFDLVLYTAGEEDYATEVLKELDPTCDLFLGRFFRSSCVQNPDTGEFLKDLKRVPRVNLKRCVLVDNNPASFAMQPNNGILIESFYVSATDRELRVLFDVLCHMDRNCEDVRVFLGPLRT